MRVLHCIAGFGGGGAERQLSYLAAGMTIPQILDDFPYLTEEDILACLSYAADREHQTLVVQ